jgi:hypothetical protein
MACRQCNNLDALMCRAGQSTSLGLFTKIKLTTLSKWWCRPAGRARDKARADRPRTDKRTTPKEG